MWRAISPGKTFEDGEDLVVFFSQGSGSTHLLTPVAAFIMELLEASPRSTEELLGHLAQQVEGAAVDSTADEELQGLLGNLLEELEESELIEADLSA